MARAKTVKLTNILDMMKNPPDRPVLITVPPIVAEEVLEHYNRGNRKLRPKYAEALKSQMENGDWDDDAPQILVFSKKNLIDGQHRLTAAMNAEQPFTAWALFGAHEKVADVLDAGQPRMLRDQLYADGVKNAALVATALNQINYYQSGGKKEKLTIKKGKRLMKQCRDLQAAVERAKKFKELGYSPGTVAAILWIIYEHNRKAAINFEDAWYRGKATSETQPIMEMARGIRLMRDQKNRIHHAKLMPAVMRAYTAFIEGRKVKRADIFETKEWPVLPTQGSNDNQAAA